MFHDSPEELQITSIMCAVQDAPSTIEYNTNSIDRQNNSKQERDNMVKRERLEKATYEFIQCLTYRQMWDYDQRHKTAGELKKQVRALKLNKDKASGLNYNIQMHYKGLSRVEAKSICPKNENKKTIPEFQDPLIDIIKLTMKWHVPDEPPTASPQRMDFPIVGKLSNRVKDLYQKAESK